MFMRLNEGWQLCGRFWLTILNRDSISEIKRLVRRHDRLLREIASNTRHIRETHGVNVPESVLGTDEASQSMFSQLIDDTNQAVREIASNTRHIRKPHGVNVPEAVGTDEASQSIFSQLIDNTNHAEAEFEKALLGTKLYTRAFNGVFESTSDKQSESDDVQTMVNSKASNRTPTNCLAELKNRVEVLDIKDIYPCDSRGDRANWICDLEKLTKHRYQGKGLGGSIQEYNRTTVFVSLQLKEPIKVSRTKAGRNESDQDRNGDEEKEMISIDVSRLCHCIICRTNNILRP